jgi:hypothetical protein
MPDGSAVSEDMVFGLGSGMDFQFGLRPGKQPPLYIAGRGGGLEMNLARRTGIDMRWQDTDDADEAWARVKAVVDAGEPVLVYADVYELDYLKAKAHWTLHSILVVGYDEEAGVAFVADGDREEIQSCPMDSLRRARASSGFPGPMRNAFLGLEFPKALPNLREAIPLAVRAEVETFGESAGKVAPDDMGGAGLSGVDAFGRIYPLWNEIFSPEDLQAAMQAIYLYVEKGGTGFGGFFRRIYGRFLSEAATIMGDSRYAAAAEHYRRLGDAWSALGDDFREAARSPGPDQVLREARARVEDLVARERE